MKPENFPTVTTENVMNISGPFPFRLGCTSWVLPDGILPNVTFLAGKVDDIELVFFESDKWSDLPDKNDVLSMQHIAEANDMTYSVHFPIDCRAGSADRLEQQRLLTNITEIVHVTENLPVSGYLLHLEGLNDKNDPLSVQKWFQDCDWFCDALTNSLIIEPTMICVENIGYTPDLHEQLIEKYSFSHCIDIGHCWMMKDDRSSYTTQLIEKSRIIHLHGVADGRDHRSLRKHENQEQLQRFIVELKEYSGIVTLEVFGESDTLESIEWFGTLWDR